jgi:hypothetical protein
MTISKSVLVERPSAPHVAPNTVVIYAQEKQLYMKDDWQQETLMMSAPSGVDFVVMSNSVQDIDDRTLRMYDDNYASVHVYPTLAAGATVVSAGADWVLGALSEVVPAATITSDFLIHMVSIETMSKDGVYELVLYSGAADDEVARVRFSVTNGFFGNAVYRMPSALVAANSRVRAALACSDGLAGAATATVSIVYRPLAI